MKRREELVRSGAVQTEPGLVRSIWCGTARVSGAGQFTRAVCRPVWMRRNDLQRGDRRRWVLVLVLVGVGVPLRRGAYAEVEIPAGPVAMLASDRDRGAAPILRSPADG